MRATTAIVTLTLVSFSSACELLETEQETRTALLSGTNMEDPGPGLGYGAWLVVDGEPVALGRVALHEYEEVAVEVGVEDIEAASDFMITVERDGVPGPSASVIVAGAVDPYGGGWAGTRHDLAMGTDFSQAGAAFIIDTPTTATVEDAAQGVWWVDPSGGDALGLPELTAGWIYEGWVVANGKRHSTGRFSSMRPDSDGAGPFAGPSPGYDAPGQDFIEPPVVLDGATIEITVEPEPDASAEPFFVTPFVLVDIFAEPPRLLTPMFKQLGTAESPGVELELLPLDQ
jgi:hypothetical protein